MAERCPVCGSLLTMPHLRNCKLNNNMSNNSSDSLPTQAQIKYATDLIIKLGYDLDEYDLERMTGAEISKLIGELAEQYG